MISLWGCNFQMGGLAYDKLKERFMIEPVLITPDLDKKMRVEVDISDFTTEKVLSMKCKDEK